MMMKTLLTGLLVLFVAVNCATAAWYDGAWAYRQKITIDGSQVSGTLTNFPLLLTEACIEADVWSRAQTNGNDIVFTQSDGVTKLSHELERYNTNDQTVVAWVQIPELSSVTGTELWMYYGNAGAANQEDAGDVWADYAGVWHLGEAVENGVTAVKLNHLDSTANAHHGSHWNNDDIAGKIGIGQDFEGPGEMIYVEDNLLPSNSHFTVSWWHKSDPAMIDDGNGEVFIRWGDGASKMLESVLLADDSDRHTVWLYDNDYTWVENPPVQTSNVWYYTVIMYDGTDVITGRNGSLGGGSAIATNWNPRIYDANGPFEISKNSAGNNVDGIMDEVRVCSSARSADWVTTEYNNQSSPSTFAFSSGEFPQRTLIITE
jgi:hypothetical protein